MAKSDDCINRKPVEQIVGQIEANFTKYLGRPVKPRSSLEMIAAIVGAIAFEVTGDIQRLRDQLFIDTMCCDSLERYAAGLKIYKRPASRSRGFVRLSGIAGTQIPADIEFVSDGGFEYRLDDTATNPSVVDGDGTATLLIQAVLPGIGGNILTDGDSVGTGNMTISVSGLDQRVVFPDGMGGGAETETCEELRERLKSRQQNALIAGNKAFYDAAIREFPGVERVCFSGCSCDNCSCSPVITAYPFFGKDVYPPHGVPPDIVLNDILKYVFGERNGHGEGLAPAGAIGQVLPACPCPISVKIYTSNAVNPQSLALIKAAVDEFFDTITCVGETFCIANVMQTVVAADPSVCVRAIHICGECVEEEGGEVTIGCGKFPVVEGVSVENIKPPENPCA